MSEAHIDDLVPLRSTREPIRGRGASRNLPNRFEPVHVERDSWTDPDDPLPRTELYRDASRSIIATNESPDVGFEASVNPYRGCEHGCVYCVDAATPVLMADGTATAIAELEAGDEIYGTRRGGTYRHYVKTVVLDRWATEKEAYRITLADGTRLVASGDHRFLTRRGWKFVTGRQQGARRRPHLTLNDQMLGVGRTARTPSPCTEYRRGYLCGMIRGDGHLPSYEYDRPDGGGGSRQHQFRLALVDRSALERSRSYLREFGVGVRRFRFREADETHRAMRAIRTHRRRDVERIRKIIAWPTDQPTPWIRGFLAGIFDAEGSYSGGILRITNTDAGLVAIVRNSLRRLAFDVVIEVRKRDRARPLRNVRVRGGLKEHLRFFHHTDPAIRRKRDITGTALKCNAELDVTSVEPLGKRTLFDITTGTGDFIADGIVSHNCYARPTHEYLGLSAGLDFERKIFVKERAPELLREALADPGWEPKTLVMSGVTDPYQPAERRLEITRGCLEVLAEFRNPVSVITKSDLVTRDIDHLSRLAAVGAARVSLSVTTLRNEIQRVMEPRACVPARRLEAIRRLAGAGIPVSVNVAPVVPGLTDHEIPEILEAAADAGADGAGYIVLRLPHGVADLFAEWLEQHFPDRREKVLNRIRSLRGGALNDPRFGIRMKGEGPFADQIRQVFEVGRRRAGLGEERRPLSAGAFRRPHDARGQLGLFDAG